MRTILAKLNNIINTLEANGFVKEAGKLDDLFNEMAEKQMHGEKMPDYIKSLQVEEDEDSLFDKPAQMSKDMTERSKDKFRPTMPPKFKPGFDPSMNVEKEFGADELGTAEYADVFEKPIIKIKRVD